MPHCTKCKTDKDDSDFSRKKQKNGTTIPAAWCKKCYAIHNNAKYHSCAERRASIRSVHAAHCERNMRFMRDYLVDKSCITCGESDPVVLEFNHREPSEKHKAISIMVRRGNSIAALSREIEKCDILCANCHRRHTAVQFAYYKTKW